MHAVETVHTEIGDQTAAVIPEPTIRVHETVLVEGHVGRRAEKQVPIRPGRRLGIGDLADALRMHVDVVPNAHEMDWTQHAATDDLPRLAIMGGGTVLDTD